MIAANANIGVARAAYFPTLTLGAAGRLREQSLLELAERAELVLGDRTERAAQCVRRRSAAGAGGSGARASSTPQPRITAEPSSARFSRSKTASPPSITTTTPPWRRRRRSTLRSAPWICRWRSTVRVRPTISPSSPRRPPLLQSATRGAQSRHAAAARQRRSDPGARRWLAGWRGVRTAGLNRPLDHAALQLQCALRQPTCSRKLSRAGY